MAMTTLQSSSGARVHTPQKKAPAYVHSQAPSHERGQRFSCSVQPRPPLMDHRVVITMEMNSVECDGKMNQGRKGGNIDNHNTLVSGLY